MSTHCESPPLRVEYALSAGGFSGGFGGFRRRLRRRGAELPLQDGGGLGWEGLRTAHCAKSPKARGGRVQTLWGSPERPSTEPQYNNNNTTDVETTVQTLCKRRHGLTRVAQYGRFVYFQIFRLQKTEMSCYSGKNYGKV
jgi:hypothetical protein